MSKLEIAIKALKEIIAKDCHSLETSIARTALQEIKGVITLEQAIKMRKEVATGLEFDPMTNKMKRTIEKQEMSKHAK